MTVVDSLPPGNATSFGSGGMVRYDCDVPVRGSCVRHGSLAEAPAARHTPSKWQLQALERCRSTSDIGRNPAWLLLTGTGPEADSLGPAIEDKEASRRFVAGLLPVIWLRTALDME
ncbi:hypothetical protein FJ546_10400 [Mesorhizobium sp. B2-4-19]|uniref:hypothetical protein n=1 Tax=Mesorhizobium sp. B2-4-19 TaxID=2589930 RepID=UPI0011268B4A|nr:hypothetical protein [Mesorhizobium sp. B2-4-19]TPK65580.1 hypothetical protein FJ546_10400 [Mesorhizobium sp. B2-4-19]